METALPAPNTREPSSSHLVGAALIGILGLLLAAAGITGIWARSSGDHGYVMSGSHRYAAAGRAIVSGSIDANGIPDGIVGKLKVSATSASGKPLFIGVGRRADVDRYLAGVAHSTLQDVDFGPFRPTYSSSAGSMVPGKPAAQRFWSETKTGTGALTVSWTMRKGTWRVVAMNADGSPQVAADAKAGVSIRGGLAIVLSLLGAGLVFTGVAAALVMSSLRRR